MDKVYFINYNILLNKSNSYLINILFGNNYLLVNIAKDILMKYRLNELNELEAYYFSKKINLDDAWCLKDCDNTYIADIACKIVDKSIDDSFIMVKRIK